MAREIGVRNYNCYGPQGVPLLGGVRGRARVTETQGGVAFRCNNLVPGTRGVCAIAQPGGDRTCRYIDGLQGSDGQLVGQAEAERRGRVAVAEAIQDHQQAGDPVSRVEIADELGISKTTVTAHVNALVEVLPGYGYALVETKGESSENGGRPPHPLQILPNS
ncbi:MAG: winged helix-turn-helix transcriptional regulator [Patescibacteria group bacterium]|nr:winged helix-turn-helix transcriptional regulator [Patescibacteria group bacterium]MDE2589209.1 winged helix-turn-helix transcriptional regulator [Patescibacteria group bacterium]